MQLLEKHWSCCHLWGIRGHSRACLRAAPVRTLRTVDTARAASSSGAGRRPTVARSHRSAALFASRSDQSRRAAESGDPRGLERGDVRSPERDRSRRAVSTLTGLVIGETTRNGIWSNSELVRQTEGVLEPALELDYTVFDWNERVHALRAARDDLFATDYALNNTHLQVIDAVTNAYFRLLNSEGQVDAAVANLKNAQTVADQVNARLDHGLATLPDALRGTRRRGAGGL